MVEEESEDSMAPKKWSTSRKRKDGPQWPTGKPKTTGAQAQWPGQKKSTYVDPAERIMDEYMTKPEPNNEYENDFVDDFSRQTVSGHISSGSLNQSLKSKQG